MASKLKAVDPSTAEPSKPKILIYGRPGQGKTWTSLDFPNCYYIDTEGGANLKRYTDKLKASGGVYFGPEQGSQDFGTIIEEVKTLATEDHKYKTLVIDSISKIFNTEISVEYETMKKNNRDMGKTFGAEKKPAINLTKELVRWIDRLDMSVILIAHEKAEYVNDKVVGTTFDCHDKLGHELHLCMNIVKMGNSHKAIVKKSRFAEFEDGESIEWSYNEFAKRYGKSILEKASKKIVLATPEHIAILNGLIEVTKLPDGQTEKWFKAANVDRFEDMDDEKIIKIIDYVKNLTKKVA